MQPFGVGVLGATGFIGTPYRAEIREACTDARIVALCARRRDLLEAAAWQDDAPFISDDWQKVVEHPDVNLVVVEEPPSTSPTWRSCWKNQRDAARRSPISQHTT